MLKLGGRNILQLHIHRIQNNFTNDEIIKSNNLTIPTTYEDLLGILEQLKSSGVKFIQSQECLIIIEI